MSVVVTMVGPLREASGVSNVDSEAGDVAALLEELTARFGKDFGKKARACRIVVNGQPIQFRDGRRTTLQDGDEVAMVYPMGGG